jgi:hypothetical protein
MTRRTFALAVILLLSSCGNSKSDGSTGTTAAEAPPLEALLSCAGPPFDAAAFDAEPINTNGDSPELRAFRSASPRPFPPDAGPWRELGRSDTEIGYGAGEPPLLDAFIVLRREGDGWGYARSGSGCVVRPLHEGRAPVRWGLQPADQPGPPTRLFVANDEQCAGSAGASERLDEPTIVETTETVTITFTATPTEGTCPSHPPAIVPITLASPLGDRRLLDGGIYPPQPPCRVENGDCVPTARELAEKQ